MGFDGQTFEIKTSQYDDPDQKSGQHTNGSANIFVREDDSCPWYLIDSSLVRSKHRCKLLIEEIGLQAFQSQFCVKIER